MKKTRALLLTNHCRRNGVVEPLETRIAPAGAGSLDLSFGGGDGIAVVDHLFKELIESGDAMAVQADGKILIAGSATDGFGRFFPDLLLVRLNANGSPDLSFGTNGQVTFDFGGSYYSREEAFAVVVQADGKIVVGGRSALTNSDTVPIDFDFALARFSASGNVDTTFGTGGFVRTDFGSQSDAVRGLALGAGGTIYAVGETGSDAAVAGYTASGALDTAFDTDGKFMRDLGGADSLRSAVVQPDGKLVAAGTTRSDFAAVRFTTAGALDATFGNAGVTLVDFGGPNDEARAVALDSANRIVLGGGAVVGQTNDFALARLTTAGVLDASFGTGGKTTFNVSANAASAGTERIEGIAIQADGKIVVAGTGRGDFNRSQWHAARLTATGALDSGYGSGGVVRLALDVATYGTAAGVALSSGQIVIAGTRQSDAPLQRYSLGAMKLTTSGALDTAFSGDGVALFDALGSAQNSGDVSTMLADGRILIAENVRVTARNSLAGSIIAVTRLLADGSRDATFGVNGTVQVDFGGGASIPRAILEDPDGKIVLAGERDTLNSNGVLAGDATLARLTASGSLDTTFGVGGVVVSIVEAPQYRLNSQYSDVVRQADGKLVALGYGTDFAKITQVVVSRYNADGTPDASFAGDGRAELAISARGATLSELRLLPDGGVLLAGTDKMDILQLVRLTASGTLDTTFDGDGIAKPGFRAKVGGVIVNGDGTISVAAGRGESRDSEGTIETYLNPAIVQFTAAGALDSSFSGDGVLPLSVSLVQGISNFQRDGAGRYFLGLSGDVETIFARFGTDGLLDTHFGTRLGAELRAFGMSGMNSAFPRADGTAVVVGNSLSTNDALVVRLTADPVAPAGGLLSFEYNGVDFPEAMGDAVINVVRLGGSVGAVTVQFAITGGTAQAGSDYTIVSGTLTFADGVTSQSIAVPILADTIGEKYETIELTLTNATGGAALQFPDKHEVGIVAHNGALGSIDPTFGVNGIALSDHTATIGGAQDREQITDMAYAPNGDIIVIGTGGGSADFFLSRFHADGSPDLAFGSKGSVSTDVRLSLDVAESVGILQDGRIIVAGFGNTEAFGDSVHYDGSLNGIGGANTKQLVLARYLADGSLDPTYGENGLVIFGPRSLPGRTGVSTEVVYEDYVVLPSGEVIAGISARDYFNNGSSTEAIPSLIRFRADGSLDTTFGGDGLAESGLVDNFHSSIALGRQADGKLVFAFGTGDYQDPEEERTALVRFSADGVIDKTFGTNGRVQIDALIGEETSEYPKSISFQEDGKILLGGAFSPAGDDGRNNPDVAARDDSGFIARLNANGTLDTTFSTDGIVLFHGLTPRTSPTGSGSEAVIFDVAQLPNGKIVAVGSSLEGSALTPVVVEYLADGTLDPQFGINGVFRVTGVKNDGILTLADAALLVTPSNEILAGFGGKLSSETGPNSQFTVQRIATQGAAGRLQWSFSASSAEESDGLASFTIERVGGTVGSVSVAYTLNSGTATAGADFVAIGGTVTFADGQTTAEILVPILSGDALENTETFSAILSAPTGGATLGGTVMHNVSILDGPDRFEFSSPVLNFLEGSQFVTVQVLRKGGATGQASVDYSLRGIEATNGIDFDALESGTLAFASGQTSASIRFALRADTLVEGREGIALALLNPLGGPVLGNIASATASVYESAPGKGANAGALDSDFGTGGVSVADVFAGDSEQSRDVLVLPNGKILVVGESGGSTSDFLLARYLENGTLDVSFGTGGTVTTDFFGGADSARAVALDARGRIVVSGWALKNGRADFAVARYLADGTLDSSFDTDGRVMVDFSGFDDRAAAMAFTEDGSIVLAGWTSGVQKFDMAVAVILEDGSLDTTFSADGRATVDFGGKQDMANAVIVQPDGGIVLGGTVSRRSAVTAETSSDYALVRLTPSGAFDTTFSGDGKLIARDFTTTNKTTNTVLNSLALRGDGRIIFGGAVGSDILLGEVTPSGAVSFYSNDNFTSAQLGGNVAFTSSREAITDIAFASDGKILVTGYTVLPGETTERLFVKRFESDYRFDVDFALSSISYLPTQAGGRAMAFGASGNIITTGGEFEVAQLLKTSATPKEGAFSLGAVAYSIAENGGSLLVTVSRPHEASYGFVTVDYATAGISAQPGQDFTPVSGTLTFRETETVKTFSIPIINDVLYEYGAEKFGIVLANPTGGAQLSSASYATVAIGDNDQPTVNKSGGFSAQYPEFDDFVFESFVLVTVKRSGGSLGAVTIDYHTEEGTAKAGEDFVPKFGTLSFAAGETSKQIFITGITDDLVEGTEIFYLKFTTPTGGSTLDLGFNTMTLAMSDSVASEPFFYAGRADTTFDTDGRVSTDSGAVGADSFTATVQQADGKLVSVGTAANGIFLARYKADGSLDTTFGTAGKTLTSLGTVIDGLGIGIHILPDGKFLVLGVDSADGKREEFVMTRYSANGLFDSSFGIVRTPVQTSFQGLSFKQGNGDVAVGADGKFVVATYAQNGTDVSDLALLRFLPTGKLDTTFGTGGTLTYDLGFSFDNASSVSIQPDGKLLVTFATGTARAVRFNVDGSVDTAFGTNGVVSANPAETLLSPGLIYEDRSEIRETIVLPDGDILLLGQAYGSAKPLGSPLNFTESLRGGVLMLRYNSNGTLDTAFGTNGVKEVVGTNVGQIGDATLDEAGKIVVLGGGGFARILADGRADPGFGPDGRGAFGSGSDLLVQADGHVVIAGGSAFSPGDAQMLRFIGGPSAGALRLNALTVKVGEAGGMIVIPVERIAGLDGAVSVTFSTANGTATAGSDYTATTQVLTWANLEVGVKFVSIPITNDLLADAGETFTFSLSNPTGGAVLSVRKDGTATIVDDDQPGVLEFSKPAFFALENAATATFTVHRKDGNLGAVSAAYSVTGGTAIAGQDFAAFSGTVNFANGETEKTITLSLIDDLAIGEDKTLIVTLATPTGGATLGATPAARLTIVDDEIPLGGAFGFGAAEFETREDGGGYLLTVLRTGGSSGAASVNLTVAAGTARDGLDFIPFSTTVAFLAGHTSASVFIPVFDNAETNPTRTIALSLDTPTGELVLTTLTAPTIGSDGTATLNILDTDAFPVRVSPGSFEFLGLDVNAQEQSGFASVIIIRNDGTAGAASVTISFTAGSAKATRDFNATPIVVEFADGELSKTVRIPLRNDFLGEADETFSATLSAPTGGTSLGTKTSASITIIDDEGCPLADFDNDGKLDLVVTKGAKFFLHLGDGIGGFGSGVLLPAVKGGKEFLTADFTGDGNADVVIMSAAKKSVFLLRGKGDGTFETPQAFLSGKATKALITADFNGDGRLDLAALQSKGVNVLLNNGNGFGAPTTLSAGKAVGALVAGDFTGDGRTDLAVTNGGLKPAISVLPSKGTEGFGAPLVSRLGKSTPGLKATSVLAGDFNGDGNLDLTGIISKNRFALFTGIGGGRFGTNDIVAAPKGAKLIVTADFEDDLDFDLGATAAKKTVSAVTNSGSGRFTAGTLIPANFAPTKFYACDLNGDEDADLIFANNKDKFKVLIGSAGATFIDPSVTARIAAVIAGDGSI